MQLGSLIASFSPPSRRCRKFPPGASFPRARPAVRGRGAPARSCSGTTGRSSHSRSAACRHSSPQAPSRSLPRRSFSASRRRPWRTGSRRRISSGRPFFAARWWRRFCPGCRSSFFVDELRVLQHRIDRQPFPIFEFAEKAALAPRVARDAPHLLHLQQDRVGVAVDAHLAHLLHIARLLALAPKLPARARPVDRFVRFGGLLQGIAVHPCHGQDFSALCVLRDDGDQAVSVPCNFVEAAHKRTSMPRLCMCSLTCRTVSSPKWNTLAPSTALAPPAMTPSAKCSALPAPPEAMSGTRTASRTACVSPISKPCLVPSRSMLVR